MHRALTAVGITALVLGSLVALVPIFPVPSGTQTVGNGTIADFEVHSLVFPLYIELPWTSNNTTTEVFAVDCGPQMPVGAALSPCSQGTILAKGTGSSGTLSIHAQNGDWIYVGANNGMAKISLRVSNGEVGFASIVLGAVLLVMGLTIRTSRGPKGTAPSSRSSRSRETGERAGPETSLEEDATDEGKGSSIHEGAQRSASRKGKESEAIDPRAVSPASTGSESEASDSETSPGPGSGGGSDRAEGEEGPEGENGGPSEDQVGAPGGPADEPEPKGAGRSEVGTS